MNDTFQAIIDAIKRQEHHHAENLCWVALKKQPNSSELNKWLGISLLQQKKYEGAIVALLQSLPDKKNDFDVINNIAFAYRHVEDYANAIVYLDKAEVIKPNQYAVTMNRAHISFNLKNYEEAFQLTEKCFDFIKNTQKSEFVSHQNLMNLYVEIQLARNKIDEAVDLMQKVLKEKFEAKVFYNLANADPSKIHEKLKKEAEGFASNESQFFLNRAAAFLGLGRIYEKEKKYKEAFENYRIGNKIKSEKLRFKPFLAQENIKENIKYFNKNRYEEFYKDFDTEYMTRGENIVFVVGNPRSGTTLVESILGSSDKVMSAGELNALVRMAPVTFENIMPKKIQEIGDEYLRILKNYNREERYQFVIDKMPANIYNVGLIKLCFPSAKVICLDRRPLDNAWSIFTQLYLGNIPYSSDLFNLGVALSNVETLKRVWLSQNDNNNFLLVNYEEMVGEPQKYSKEIYNFVGLDENYDEEKRKKFSSRTASKTQIKKDIYTSSISRSKDYDVFLEEFEKSFKNQNEYWNKYLKDQKIL